ncbi:MAG TPA: phosphate regulon sensor histidine kinase PhoR [Arenicellales bacterium]|nr:phosphate regulon sensor histidine kinase PhoR [Arenicellales bacterium]
MNSQWRGEIGRILLVGSTALVVGLWLGTPFLPLALVLAAYLAWHLGQARRFSRWLAADNPLARSIPSTAGVWTRVYRVAESRLAALTDRGDRMREQMERYRQVARALPDAAVMFNRDGEIELANQAARRLLDLRDPEDLGRPVRNLLRVPRFIEYLDRGSFDAPLEMTSPVDAEITLSVTIVPYGEVDKYLLLARDTSRLNRLERMRRDFIANVSHELKSPLTVIKGYAENLSENAADAGRRDRAVAQINQQAERMCSIVEDLLALSNLETGPEPESLKVVDVPALIRSVMAEAAELSQRRHHFQLEIDERLHLLGNFNELYSAFSNVVFNAVSYTDEGGTISVTWGVQANGYPRFAVSDTGIGIAPEHIPRLTERFYRVDQARSRELGGTGLGLAIVKHVLMRHRGRLIVDSEPGGGSTFACVFSPEMLRRRAPDARPDNGQ